MSATCISLHLTPITSIFLKTLTIRQLFYSSPLLHVFPEENIFLLLEKSGYLKRLSLLECQMKLKSFNLNLFNKYRTVEIDIEKEWKKKKRKAKKKMEGRKEGTGNFTSATAKTEIARNWFKLLPNSKNISYY